MPKITNDSLINPHNATVGIKRLTVAIYSHEYQTQDRRAS